MLCLIGLDLKSGVNSVRVIFECESFDVRHYGIPFAILVLASNHHLSFQQWGLRTSQKCFQ
jgi:hypothetical protein